MNVIKRLFAATSKFFGIANTKPSFEDFFKQEFDPIFEKRLCDAMHKMNIGVAFMHPSQSLDQTFHQLWEELVFDSTFSSCFFKAQNALMEFPDFDEFKAAAKLSYYERSLAAYKFIHPVLGIAQENEMEVGF